MKEENFAPKNPEDDAKMIDALIGGTIDESSIVSSKSAEEVRKMADDAIDRQSKDLLDKNRKPAPKHTPRTKPFQSPAGWSPAQNDLDAETSEEYEHHGREVAGYPRAEFYTFLASNYPDKVYVEPDQEESGRVWISVANQSFRDVLKRLENTDLFKFVSLSDSYVRGMSSASAITEVGNKLEEAGLLEPGTAKKVADHTLTRAERRNIFEKLVEQNPLLNDFE